MGADLYKAGNCMDNKGYFRDSYNSTNLLWQLGLNWWVWFKSYLNKNRDLTPDKAKEVLAVIKSKELPNPPKFEHPDSVQDPNSPDWYKFFTECKQEFETFLQEAIDNKQTIHCSI